MLESQPKAQNDLGNNYMASKRTHELFHQQSCVLHTNGKKRTHASLHTPILIVQLY